MKKNILLATLHPEAGSNQLALWYLKTYLLKSAKRTSQIDVPIFVLPLSHKDETEFILGKICSHRPDVIGFSCYIWNIEPVLKISGILKELMPKVKLVLGGPEVSPRARELLEENRFLDVVVRGEGEVTFKELADFFLFRKGDIKRIKGIAYRIKDRVLVNAPRPEIEYLGAIPSPFLEGTIDINFREEVPIETSRGCTYRCHYCYYHKDFKSVRCFPMDRVERELKILLARGARMIYIMDPTFNVNRERAKRILEIIAANNKVSQLHVELKAELLDSEFVDLLHKAKASSIEIGIQTTNRESLKLMNRSFDPDAFRKSIALLNEKKIPYEVQLIYGLPADDYSSFKGSIDWVLGLKPPRLMIARLELLPGSYIREHARRFGIKYYPAPPYSCLESNTYSNADIVKTERLRTAISLLCDRGLMRRSLYVMLDELKASPTEVIEEWIGYVTERYGFVNYDVLGKPVFRKDDALIITRMSESRRDFIRYICNKHNCTGAVLRRILAQTRYDFEFERERL